jgi:hypothetical protein
VWRSEQTKSYRTSAKVLSASQMCIQAHQKSCLSLKSLYDIYTKSLPSLPKSVFRCTKSLTVPLKVYPCATKVSPTPQKCIQAHQKTRPPAKSVSRRTNSLARPSKVYPGTPKVLPSPPKCIQVPKSLANPLEWLTGRLAPLPKVYPGATKVLTAPQKCIQKSLIRPS